MSAHHSGQPEITAEAPAPRRGIAVFRALVRCITALLDLALPLECIGCGAPRTALCFACEDDLPRLRNCVIRKPSPHLKSVIVCADYDRGLVRDLIHAFKYQGVRRLAPVFFRLMSGAVARTEWGKPSAVVPVPLHRRRLLQRGYNQSELLARPLAEFLNVPLHRGLHRVKHRASQTGMSREKRLTNVAGCFVFRAEHAPARVLLVDDIATTFATLESAARALRSAGVGSVRAVVLARSKD